ncbi:glycosyltransferase [Flavobacterium sp. FBOR7N2.3]|uniref:Glycosyltransferase n=1 Tax=Flavobacterium magnesitis TaxID=3138077 RepID=A0ABV4TN08_9FLAO
MIPKIIHYCWFGKNPKSELIENCINSWKENLPDYKIIEWNEENFDVNSNVFTKEAYQKKKWAFVTDYVRAYSLYTVGGIYLDTDVEIRHNLDFFLHHSAFSGFEEVGFPFTALWGAKKGHDWPKKIIDYYKGLETFSEKTNTRIVSDFLVNFYKVDPNKDEIQNLEDGICIYPSNYFCLNIEKNYAVHHFEGSWLEVNNLNYDSSLLRGYYKNKFLNYFEKKQIIEDLYNEKYFSLKDLLFFILKKLKEKYVN